MFGSRLKNKRGSGFAELMVALSILSVILISLIPSFIYATKATLRNNLRTNGYNLGIRQLERIKSLDYENVGIRSGNPTGSIDYLKTENRNGVPYIVRTRVTWIDDTSDGLYPADNDPRDYKRVQVSISLASSANGLASFPVQQFSTDITRQSQEQIAVGGNIEVTVVDPENNPVTDAVVKIVSGPSGPQELYSEENGKAIFQMLTASTNEGDYSLNVSKEGFVVEPTMKNLTTTVRQGENRLLQFIISQPGQINVSLVDEETGQQINSPSKLILSYPNAPPVEYEKDAGMFTIQDLYPGIYETKGLNDQFELVTERDVRVNANNTTNLTLRLRRKTQGNLHLTVLDDQTSEAVPYANVTITGQNPPLNIQDITNIQGIMEKQLGQQTFNLQVSKENYQTNLSAFTIDRPGNTFVTIRLARSMPTGGTIRVIMRTRNGQPVEGALILVMGPNYSRRLNTNSNGEAVFTGLNYGWYNVYRWGWGWRLVGQPLMRNGAEKTYVVRY